MNLNRRIKNLSMAIDDAIPEMTTPQRHHAIRLANCTVGFEPELVLVERRDCERGDAGTLLYLQLREHTLWHQRSVREAELVRAQVIALKARLQPDPHAAPGDDMAAMKAAIANALRRLGKEPTPPPLGVLTPERLYGLTRTPDERSGP